MEFGLVGWPMLTYLGLLLITDANFNRFSVLLR